jgi:hypothetical protein
MNKTDLAIILEFGNAGHSMELFNEYGTVSHLSGYAKPETFCMPYHWWADSKDVLTRHWDNMTIPPEGIPVLDKIPAIETKAGFEWVFRGPMLNPKLSDGEIDACPNASPLLEPAIAAYGMKSLYADTKVKQAQGKAGPLDGVYLTEYIEGWLKVGARLGRFTVDSENNGKITWQD